MENDDHPREEHESLDMNSSLGYGQGMEYQYLNPTQSMRLNRREKRLRQLQSERLERKQSDVTPSAVEPTPKAAPQRTSIGRAALIITGSMVVSRILGLVRSSLFIYVLGANGITDAYNRAFVIPNLVFTVVAGGALMSAFIPVFNEYSVSKRDTKTAWHIASAALNLSLVCMLILTVVAIIFMRPLVALYSINVSAATLDLVVSLTRIMLLQSIVMGMGVIVNAVLNVRQHFLLPAIGSLLYPVGMILGLLPGFVLLLLQRPNQDLAIYGATWGVVLGAILMVGIQIPGLRKVGMHYSFTFDWRHPGVRQIARLMVPRMLNAVMINISTVVDLILIGLLVVVVGSVDGFIAQYTLAFTVVMIPQSGIIAVATAAFPTITAYVAEGRLDRVRALVMESMRSILFVSLPASLGLALLSLPVVQVLYEHGSFTLNNALITSIPLACFAVGLPGLALVEILARTFYALRDSKTTVAVSVAQFILKIALSLLLLDPAILIIQHWSGALLPPTLNVAIFAGAWGMGAMALATSLAVLLEAVMLLWLLQRRIGGLELRALLSFLGRMVLAVLAMCLALLIVRWLLDTIIVTGSGDGKQSLGLVGIGLVALKLGIVVCVGSFVYLRVARFLRLLNSRDLRSVNRLLVRLRLSWI